MLTKTVKYLLTIVCLLAASCIFTLAAHAAVVNSGTCGAEGKGENLTWELNDEGTLTISGQGDMQDFVKMQTDGIDQSSAPWSSYAVRNLVIQGNLSKIGKYAFYKCDNLYNINLNSGLAEIDDYAFYDCCLLKDFSIPDTVKSIGSYAFHRCKSLTKLIIPDSVTRLGDWSFRGCESLRSISFGKGLTVINARSFSGCRQLTALILPDNIKTIEQYAFYTCEKLKGLQLPENLTTIGPRAFSGCKELTSVTIPPLTERIQGQSFSNCDALICISIPASVKHIADSVFLGCKPVIWGEDDSYVKDWADQHELIFKSLCPDTHDWQSNSVIQKATCSEAGMSSFVCSICGVIKTQIIEDVKDHLWDNGFLLQYPSADKSGIIRYTCTFCNSIKDDVIIYAEGDEHYSEEETLLGYQNEKYLFISECAVCKEKHLKEYDALVTFVDDDGKAEALAHWENIVDATNIRMDSALITSRVKTKASATHSYADFTDWETVERLKEKGIEFVCHTDGHINITEYSEDELRQDFSRSKMILQQHGLRDDILVYPFLAYNNDSLAVVREYFSMGVGGIKTTNNPGTDPLRICRLTINDSKNRQQHVLNGKTFDSYTIRKVDDMMKDVRTAIERHDWVIFKSHAYNSTVGYWFDEKDEETIISFCRSIQSLDNVKIITLSEAYPILDMSEKSHILNEPKILEQPESIRVQTAGQAATTKVVADGETLTYQWYIKDPGHAAFKKSTVKSNFYSIYVTKKNTGRQAYCEITDSSGHSVQTETVTFSILQDEFPTDATSTDATPTDATPTDATPTDATPIDSPFKFGDVDGDKNVTPEDARLALRASVGLEHFTSGSPAFLAADINGDNKIGSDDARLILRASVGLEVLNLKTEKQLPMNT